MIKEYEEYRNRIEEKRADIILKAHSDTEFQQDLNAEAKEDILFYFNYFLWTNNPQVPPYHFPFILFPKQEETVIEIFESIRDGTGLLEEKSRKQGVTFMELGVCLHYWTFADSFEALLLSLKREEVDDPTVSSLFGKIRYMTRRLPFYMLPYGFRQTVHGDKWCRLINPENGNSIVGGPTTMDTSRGGRKTIVFMDEHAALPNRIAQGLERNLRHVTNSIHRVSTPRGINLFKQIRDKKICKIITAHWTTNPLQCKGLYYRNEEGVRIDCEDLPVERRSPYGFYIDENGKQTDFRLRSEYYDKECEEAVSERDVEQELNISFLGSGNCRFTGKMLENNSLACSDGKRGRLMLTPEGDIVFKESVPGQDFEIEIWQFPKKPEFRNRSVMGADTAEGLEHGDFDSADVLMKDTNPPFNVIHAAALHGHWTPDVYADKMNMLGLFYDMGAFLIGERNKDGYGILLRLRNVHKYRNLYYDPQKPVKDSQGNIKLEDRLGFYTTSKKKFMVTDDLDEGLRTGELTTWSHAHYTEMSTFENHNGILGALPPNNDDRVISLGLAWHRMKQTGRPELLKMSRDIIPSTSSLNLSKY